MGFVMRSPFQTPGFTPRTGRPLGRERRTAARAELVTTVALALCTLVAATAVSVGIARADVAANIIDHESSLFAIALMLGLLFIAMGGLTVLHLPGHKHRKQQH
jgi:hypothetical protein